jgi:hypothetical protein
MKRVLSDGIEIAVEDTGQGGPALVLIHGGFGSRSHFAPLVAHLAERHRVIALDLRGHGESGVPRDGFRIADFARDVLAVCREARNLRPFSVRATWALSTRMSSSKWAETSAIPATGRRMGTRHSSTRVRPSIWSLDDRLASS